MTHRKNYVPNGGIAIVGMAGRFPGAKNIVEFWNNLTAGKESLSTLSDQELIEAGVDIEAIRNDPNFARVGAVLEDVEFFDAAFFGVNPKEAELMDPQGRVILECSWEAVEDSGYNPETYPGSVAVYVGGSTSNTYYLTNLYPNRDRIEGITSFQTLVNNEVDSLALRISYKLNLRGPSVTVLSTCSSSLVALHQACQSLLNRHCDMALAGGISLRLPQKQGYWHEEGGMNSCDGHCRPFDERAQGTIFGSGVGIVVAKRLIDALRGRDHIYAVVKGIAINNDGASKRGYAAPSIDGQAAVIRMAQTQAGINAESISYVEAHGTATPTGDPIEVAALSQAFRSSTDNKQFSGLGSVKSNVGHLDSASGVAGLIKTALALKHKILPPTLHYEKPNPKLDIENSPFYVVDKLTEWNPQNLPRRAGLNSFGVGGTNAHAILEEAPLVETNYKTRPYQLLLLSAKTETALDKTAKNLAAHLSENGEQKLADVAYTLQVGRRAFSRRRFIVSRDANDAVKALMSAGANQPASRTGSQKEKHIVFMFPGQGSQHVNMGLELYRSEPTFQQEIDHCAETLGHLFGMDIREVIYPQSGDQKIAAEKLQQTAIAQPAIFAIEYALAKLWMEWGIVPHKMIGHSVGEFAAACISGVLNLEDALVLVAARGRLMQALPPGAMLAVGVPEEEIDLLLDEALCLAAVNGPSNCVVSGPPHAIEVLEHECEVRGIPCRYLHTSHAFHSSMMDPILDQFTDEIRKVRLSAPRIPFISSSTGTWIKPEQATDPAYWSMNVRKAVRFHDGRIELGKDSDDILLEVGPGHTLGNLARHPSYKLSEQVVVSSFGVSQDDHGEVASVLTALGQLWLEGIPVHWQSFYAREKRGRVSLPAYPFERKRYWIDAPRISKVSSAPRDGSPAHTKNASTIHRTGSAYENVMSRQLQIMASQLEMLKYRRAPQKNGAVPDAICGESSLAMPRDSTKLRLGPSEDPDRQKGNHNRASQASTVDAQTADIAAKEVL